MQSLSTQRPNQGSSAPSLASVAREGRLRSGAIQGFRGSIAPGASRSPGVAYQHERHLQWAKRQSSK